MLPFLLLRSLKRVLYVVLLYLSSFSAVLFIFAFQFPGGLPPPGLSSALGLPPSAGVPPRLDLPPGVSLGQPNSGNSMNHDKVKKTQRPFNRLFPVSLGAVSWGCLALVVSGPRGLL